MIITASRHICWSEQLFSILDLPSVSGDEHVAFKKRKFILKLVVKIFPRLVYNLCSVGNGEMLKL